MTFERVAVLGLGYIGLPTAAVLASRGLQVAGIEINPHVVDTINRGEIHIVEPDLDIVVHSSVSVGLLRAHIDPQSADAFLIAVPTPFKDGHEPDLSYVEAAVRSIAPVLQPRNVIILESTSPVGATGQMCRWLAEERPDLTFPHTAGESSDIRVAYCPERVLPGQILRELVENDRIIGGVTPACASVAADLYSAFVRGRLLMTDDRTAEMVKLTENSFRDVNIAFANELSLICDRFDINVWELIRMANHHPRVNILQPGPGVGGHCIAVDPWFIVSAAQEQSRLIRTAREVNDGKSDYVINKIRSRLSELNCGIVACLGLAFKPNVDDLRESPALRVVETLAQDNHMQIMVVEPNIDMLPPSLSHMVNVKLCTLDYALEHCGLIAALVKHNSLVEGLKRRKLSIERFLDFVDMTGPSRYKALN